MKKFNLKSHKVAGDIQPKEKYLRDNSLGPEADDKQSITEKEVPHHEGSNKSTTTEDQMSSLHTADKDSQIIEKVLNDVNGKYVDHRKGDVELTIPPITAIVEKMRHDRLEDYKPETKSNWTVDFNDKKQNGSLPSWPKSPDSKGINQYEPSQWNKAHPEAEEVVKGVTKANIDNLVHSIKTGKTLDYDAAIVAILRQADTDKRELTQVERQTISNIKIARTKSFLQK